MNICMHCEKSRNSSLTAALCLACWDSLPRHTRRALSLLDERAESRRKDLSRQLCSGTPLARTRITF